MVIIIEWFGQVYWPDKLQVATSYLLFVLIVGDLLNIVFYNG